MITLTIDNKEYKLNDKYEEKCKRVLEINLRDLQKRFNKMKDEDIEKEQSIIEKIIHQRIDRVMQNFNISKDNVVYTPESYNLDGKSGKLYLTLFIKDEVKSCFFKHDNEVE